MAEHIPEPCNYYLPTIIWNIGVSKKDRTAYEELMTKAPKQQAIIDELLKALSFYMSICGNTCYQVDRQSAQEMHAMGTKAMKKATNA